MNNASPMRNPRGGRLLARLRGRIAMHRGRGDARRRSGVLRSGIAVAIAALVFAEPCDGPHAIGGSPLLAMSAADLRADEHGLDRAAAPIAGTDTVEVGWRLLAELDYRTGERSDALKKLDGQIVKVPGFIVPLEDGADGVTEFLLVPYFGACIHMPPPPPNQIVYVKTNGFKVGVDLWAPIWVVGTLKIDNVDSYYGMVGYQLEGRKIMLYEG